MMIDGLGAEDKPIFNDFSSPKYFSLYLHFKSFKGCELNTIKVKLARESGELS